ncbi:MAG: hypothetical protein IJE74_04620 [Clostridia bacterium]|nr:hypothetical protein [Clostridia bacterium]
METNQTAATNKKMMVCKTCGASMAKSAKKCQSCGAKNPKKRIKKLIILLVIVGTIVGYPAFFIIRDNTSATITAKNGEELRYNELGDIYSDYLLNDDYSDFVEEYLPAEVVVKGKITEIDNETIGLSSNGFTAHVEAGAHKVIKIEINNEYIYMIPYDVYADADEYSFGEFNVGDKVEATGTITKSITLKSGNYINESLPSKLGIIGTEDGITKK